MSNRVTDCIDDCIEEIEIRMMNGESKEQAFNNPIYIYDLRTDEKSFVDNFFK